MKNLNDLKIGDVITHIRYDGLLFKVVGFSPDKMIDTIVVCGQYEGDYLNLKPSDTFGIYEFPSVKKALANNELNRRLYPSYKSYSDYLISPESTVKF